MKKSILEHNYFSAKIYLSAGHIHLLSVQLFEMQLSIAEQASRLALSGLHFLCVCEKNLIVDEIIKVNKSDNP